MPPRPFECGRPFSLRVCSSVCVVWSVKIDLGSLLTLYVINLSKTFPQVNVLSKANADLVFYEVFRKCQGAIKFFKGQVEPSLLITVVV